MDEKGGLFRLLTLETIVTMSQVGTMQSWFRALPSSDVFLERTLIFVGLVAIPVSSYSVF